MDGWLHKYDPRFPETMRAPTLLMTASQFKISPHPDPRPALEYLLLPRIHCAPLCATSGLQKSVKCRVGSWISDVTTQKYRFTKSNYGAKCVQGHGVCVMWWWQMRTQFFLHPNSILLCGRFGSRLSTAATSIQKTSLNVAHNILIISIK